MRRDRGHGLNRLEDLKAGDALENGADHLGHGAVLVNGNERQDFRLVALVAALDRLEGGLGLDQVLANRQLGILLRNRVLGVLERLVARTEDELLRI